MRVLRAAIREPLLHFLLIGAGLFMLFSFVSGSEVKKPNRIVISAGQVELLAAKFSRTWMRPPNQQEMTALTEGYLRDEVLYRQAIALGLDKNDNLIRRRLRQKLEFVLEDVSALVAPTDKQLTLFMHQNEERFRLKPKVSFRHLYLSVDKRRDVRTDAVKLLARLQAGEDPEQLGDPIMLASEFKLTSQEQIKRGFGEKFAQSILTLPKGVWSGPVASGFGGHLVLVQEKADGRMPELAEVREKVKRDWQLEQRKILKEKTFRKLLAGYEVIIEPPKQASAKGLATASEPHTEKR